MERAGSDARTLREKTDARRRRALRAVVLALAPPLLFVGLYLRALDYELVWTDESAIGQRTMLRPRGEVLQAFREPLHRVRYRERELAQAYYRPLQVVLLSGIDRALGPAPRNFRAAALAIGAAYTALCALLAWGLLRRVDRALFVALVVAAHPVAIEETAWISGISGSMCALFVVTAVLLALESAAASGRARAGVLGGLSALALLAALLSKERALIQPALLFAAFASVAHGDGMGFRFAARPGSGPPWRWAAGLLLAHVLLVVVYALAWRPAVLGRATPGVPPIGGSVSTQLQSALASWPGNLGWLFLPLQSSTSDVVRVVTSFWDPMTWLGAALALGSALAWVALLRARRPVAAFGLAWLWIAYLPTAGLVPMSHPRAERYLFLSTFGAALLVADLGPALLRSVRPSVRRLLTPMIAVLIVVFLAQRTWARLPDWESTLTLFQREVDRDPSYREGHYLLAVKFFERGRHAEADALLRRLLSNHRDFAGTASYLQPLVVYELTCVNHLALRRYGEVLRLERDLSRQKSAIARSPSLRTCVGQAKQGLGRTEEGLEIYLAIASELGGDIPVRLSLLIAESYAKLRRPGAALEWLGKAQTAAAGDPELEREIRRIRSRLRRRS